MVSGQESLRLEHPFRLHLSGWAEASVECQEGNDWVHVYGNGREFNAKPGVYRISR